MDKLGRTVPEREPVSRTRDQLVKQLATADRAKWDAKTAELKALRLTKEIADREARREPDDDETKTSKTRRRVKFAVFGSKLTPL
jgi:hypothetical protein